MSKKNETPASETETVKRPVGRPSTFLPGVAVTAFPSRVSQDTVDRIREMSSERQSPFSLDHNSIGAELHRIVEQAYNRFTKDRERAASRKAKQAPKADLVEAAETLSENASS